MAQTPAGVPIGTLKSASVIPGGGWVTRGAAADDGTMACGCDTASVFIRKLTDTQWNPLLRPGDNISATGLGRLGPGCYDVAFCDTDSTKIAWITNGVVFTTTDGGATVSLRIGLAGGAANEPLRMTGKMIALDPINGQVILIGCTDGLRISSDGGASWTLLPTSTVPAPVPSNGNNTRMCLAFDRNSAQVGGKTQGVYCFVNGHGLYHSPDGGTTWAAIAGAPVNASHMAVGKTDGVVHLCGAGVSEGDGQYYRYASGTWTAPSGITSKAIAPHPSVAGTIFLVGQGGSVRCSTDNGVTWGAASTNNARVPTNVAWLCNTNEYYMSNGDAMFNRSTLDLWAFEGIGPWKVTTPSTTVPSTVTWIEQALGIENLTTGSGLKVTPIDGNLLYSCWDRSGFVIPRANIGSIYPSAQALTPNFQAGMDIDYAFGTETFLVCAIRQGFQQITNFPSGYSTDGGRTWTSFPTDMTTISGGIGGGNIVAFDTNTFVWLQTNDGWFMRTTDRGNTWSRITIGDNNQTTAHHAFYLVRRCLVKDSLVSGVGYMYQVGDGTSSASNLACQGIWKTTDKGATWNRIRTGYIIGFGQDYYDGHFYQLGSNEWLWFGGDGASGLMHSTDGMVTWNAVSGIDNIYGAGYTFGWVYGVASGFGPAGAGSKAILVAGYRTNQPPYVAPTTYDGWGYWLSVDNMQNWTRMAQFPGSYYGFPNELAADPTQFGSFTMARGAEGVAQLTYADVRVQS